MRLFDELKRRKVIRVAIAYLALAWLLLQVAETLLPAYGYTDAAIRNLVAVLAVGLVLALVLAWVFDWTPQGVQKTAAMAAGSQGMIRAKKDRSLLLRMLSGSTKKVFYTSYSVEGKAQ